MLTCPYCGIEAVLVGGDAIYPHRPDLSEKKFYLCRPCEAWVGCHPPEQIGRGGRVLSGKGDGTLPLGRLANAELRRKKSAAHAAFDRLWKGGGMTRKQAYTWLQDAMRMDAESCHIGMFDGDQCDAVVALCEAREGRASRDTMTTIQLRPGDLIEYMGRVVRVRKVSSQFRSRSLWIDADLVRGEPLHKGSILTAPEQVWKRATETAQ